MMTENNKITKFGLMRHAQTEWNQQKRVQGQNDTPLTTHGEHQAKEWGRLLKTQPWDRIIASDIGRALKTATLINVSLQVPLAPDPLLREQDWGQWTGKTLTQIEQEIPLVLPPKESKGWEFCPPDGENRDMVWERSHRALQEAAARWPGETILMVIHEGVIKCLIYRLLDRQFLKSEPPVLKSQHLHWLIQDNEGLRIDEINALKLS